MVCRLLMDGVCHGHVPSGTPEVSHIRRSWKAMESCGKLFALLSGIFSLDPMGFSAGPIDIQSRGTNFGPDPAQAGLARRDLVPTHHDMWNQREEPDGRISAQPKNSFQLTILSPPCFRLW